MAATKILIVDDEADLGRAFSTVLSQEGYSIMMAANGVECLSIAQQESPDLILLDVAMPVMDGFETIKRLRMMKQFTYTPIIFLTGHGTTPAAIDSGYVLGGTEYWTKPIPADELIVRVRAVLRIAEAERKLRKLQQAFYSMVVHDLRNPIGTILGYADILLEEKDSLTEDHATMVSTIKATSIQLLQIVQESLELAHFESGEYSIQRKPVLLRAMVEAVSEKFSVIRNQKNISVEVIIEKSLMVSVDEGYIQEVLENLFDNALRYTPIDGTIIFKARLVPAKDTNGNPSIIIEVIDTGSGISNEEIPTLFDKSRITNSALRKANIRTGLGLVICREIIEAHNGTIAVESTVGEGSKFIITVPAC